MYTHSLTRFQVHVHTCTTYWVNGESTTSHQYAHTLCICMHIITSQVAGRKSASLEIKYKGHQIRPCDAVLLLVAESGRGTSGTSVAFQLHGQVTGAKPQVSLVNRLSKGH